MFYYLKGEVAHIEPGLVVVDCGGVGFACNVSLQTLSRVKVGETVKLYTHVNIRDDAFDIIAFYDTGERNCFRLLTAISGVGPKAALAILSVCSPERLAMAVIGGDEKALTAAAGVGKKLAQRIILELKDKMGGAQITSDSGAAFEPASFASGSLGEAHAALIVLGYSPVEAAAALKGIDTESLSVEQAIKQALKNLL